MDGAEERILIRVLPKGLFPQDCSGGLRERCAAGDRWRPLGTARVRWDVDQTWTRHVPLVGAAARRVADLGWQDRPPPAAPTSEPRLGDRLVRGSPGGVWARTSPCIDGLSLATGMVVPQRPACSTMRDGGCWTTGHDGGGMWRPLAPGVMELVRGGWRGGIRSRLRPAPTRGAGMKVR